MTRATDSLRLQASLKVETERAAKREGTTLNQFINVAVAEKLAALRTVDYLRERAARAKLGEAMALLESFGGDELPREEDELDMPTATPSRWVAGSIPVALFYSYFVAHHISSMAGVVKSRVCQRLAIHLAGRTKRGEDCS